MRKLLRCRRLLSARAASLLLVFMLAMAGISAAQSPSQTTTAPKASSASAPAGGATSPPAAAPPVLGTAKTAPPVASPIPYVYQVDKEETSKDEIPPTAKPKAPPSCKPSTDYPEVQLRDTIAVRVCNLEALISQLTDEHKKIVLYLNDRPISDVAADPPSDPKQNVLRFPLRRTERSREAWSSILGKPLWDPRLIKVSIGIEDQFAIRSNSYVKFRVLPQSWFIFWLFLFSILLVGFFILARRSDLLRDAVPPPGGGERRPFSLARSQVAWWFFLVLASYLFIGLVTGDYSTSITGTVLVLLGISAGTTIGSAIVDSSKDTPAERANQAAAAQALDAEAKRLDSQAASARDALDDNPGDVAKARDLAETTADLNVKRSQLRKVRNQSEEFFVDILSDANGVNFHRFQMAAWTVVLGIVFGTQVYRELAMPQFSDTLLGLMGISAGTFLGLKTTEPTTPTVPKSDAGSH
jgi:hypothetical protein